MGRRAAPNAFKDSVWCRCFMYQCEEANIAESYVATLAKVTRRSFGRRISGAGFIAVLLISWPFLGGSRTGLVTQHSSE